MATKTQAMTKTKPEAGYLAPVAHYTEAAAAVMERVVALGDLKQLTPDERMVFYNEVCASLGLNPLTRPFQFITLDGRLTMYATKDCAEQLRRIHKISTEIESQVYENGLLTVTIRATDPQGRVDEDCGVVPIVPNAAPQIRANLTKKCITQAKRRATLSICGLGFPDEGDVEDAQKAEKIKDSRKGAIRTITANTGSDAGTVEASDPGTAPASGAALGDQDDENPTPPSEAETGDPAEADPPQSEAVVDDQPELPAQIPSQPKKVEGRTIDDWDEVLRQASNTGDLKALEAIWVTIPPNQQKLLQAALDRRHKPNCYEAADKKRAGKK